jgi:hypothetical protein
LWVGDGMRRVAEEKISKDAGIANIGERETDGLIGFSAMVWFSLAMAAVLILTYLRVS